jgi:hypothetical protein
MAETYASEISGQSTIPTTMANGAVVGGRIRRFRATVTLASQAADDTVVLAIVPAGYAFAYGVINASATLGSTATVAIGTASAAGKYRAAAVFTAAAPTLFGVVGAVDDEPLTAPETVIMTVAAAALPSSGTCVVDLYFSAP